MKEVVLTLCFFLSLFGFHGRLEGVNVCLLSLWFSHSMLDISPFSGPTSPSLYSILFIDAGELECYDEVVQVDTKIQWESTMKDKMDSFLKNKTWDLCKFPTGKRALQNKWARKGCR